MSTPVKIALGAVGALVALLVIAQVALPGLAAGKVEDRLTEGGGAADVKVEAFPAARLAFGDGDRMEVDGSGLDLEVPTAEEDAFDKLDGFDEVDVDLQDFQVGPAKVPVFMLTRGGPGPYKLVMQSTVTPQGMAEFGAEALGLPALPGAGTLQLLLALGGVGAASQEIPVDLDVEVESDDGRVEVVGGTAEVAGFDAGPLAEILTTAIAVRL